MHINIEINNTVGEQLKNVFATSDVKTAIETLIRVYTDKHSQEREAARGILRGIEEAKSGKAKDIQELFDAL